MNHAIALLSLVVFVIAFRAAKVVPTALGALRRARSALLIVADRSRSDDEKERAAREAALALFGRFFLITALSAAALLPPAALLGLAVWLEFANGAALMEIFLSPWIIAAAAGMFAVDYMVFR